MQLSHHRVRKVRMKTLVFRGRKRENAIENGKYSGDALDTAPTLLAISIPSKRVESNLNVNTIHEIPKQLESGCAVSFQRITKTHCKNRGKNVLSPEFFNLRTNVLST